MRALGKNGASLSSRIHTESLRQQQQQYYQSDLSCPICLQTACFPVETNCGHLFCGHCLIEYWKHESWLRAISCPLCRQKVVLLFNTSDNLSDKQSKQIVYVIRYYNKRFSGQPRPFTDYLYAMPLLVTLVLRGIFMLDGLMWIFILRIAICSFGTIMCLALPLDGMPEPFYRILRAADDLAVIILLLIAMINMGTNMTNSTTQNVILES